MTTWIIIGALLIFICVGYAVQSYIVNAEKAKAKNDYLEGDIATSYEAQEIIKEQHENDISTSEEAKSVWNMIRRLKGE